MECNKDEAVKAMNLAEMKLSEKDFAGAKKFASKADILYPKLEGLPQLLEIIHVYITNEKKINGEDDYYGIFRADSSSHEDVLKKQYKKMALYLHPDKNKFAGADGAFKIMSHAWSILSDSDKRSAYNLKLNIGASNHSSADNQGTSTDNQGTYTDVRTPYNFFPARPSTFGAQRQPAPHIFTQHFSSGTPIYQQTPVRPPFHEHPFRPFTTPPTFSFPPTRAANTFWTSCTRCMIRFEYRKIFQNQILLCCQCRLPFLATETPHATRVNTQSASPRSFSSSQEQFFTRVSQPAPIPEEIKVASDSNAGGDLKKEEQFFTRVSQPAPIPEEIKVASDSNAGGDLKKEEQFFTRVSQPAPIPEEIKVASDSNAGGDLKKEEQFFTRVSQPAPIPKEIKLASDSNADGDLKKEKPVKKRKMEDEPSGSRSRVKRASGNVKDFFKTEESQNPSVEIQDTHNPFKTEQRGDKSSRELENEESPILEETDELDANTDETVSMMVPDANFHDFDDERVESSFSENQIWAAYDDEDGMPRIYAFLNSVISRKPFKMQISWLHSKSSLEYGFLEWIESGFTKTSGEYWIGEREVIRRLNSFSHPIKWKKGPRGVIKLFPSKGDVWAVYRNWSPYWVDVVTDEIKHKYDLVAVLEDYNESIGAVVAPLQKVAGFTSVFNLDQAGTRTIPREEMFRFSHQVPFYIINGSEAENAQKGWYELDPAALPLELLNVITDAEERVSQEDVSDAGVGSTGSGKSNELHKKSGMVNDKSILTYSRRKKRKEDGKECS